MNTHISTHRKSIRDHAAAHPITAFIILAYMISWVSWFLSLIDLGVVNGFGIIFSVGPALAAVIMAGLLNPESTGSASRKRWWLFGVSGILALGVMAVRRFWITPVWLTVAGDVTTTAAYPSLTAILVDILGAAVVAFLLSGVLSRRQGVRNLLHSLDPRSRPVRWYWWLIALGLYPAVMVLGSALSTGFGQPAAAPNATGLGYLLALDVLLTFLYFLIGGGLEEPGWRGFALPMLQKRFSPLISSLILAVIWAFWHLPMVWPQGGPLGMLVYLVMEVAPLAILFTVAFNRTGGSLPVVILLHTSINATAIFLPLSPLGSILWLGLILGLAVWMWRSPGTFSLPRVKEPIRA